MADDLIKELKEGDVCKLELVQKIIDTLEAQAREIALLREANRFLRRGLYGLIENGEHLK